MTVVSPRVAVRLHAPEAAIVWAICIALADLDLAIFCARILIGFAIIPSFPYSDFISSLLHNYTPNATQSSARFEAAGEPAHRAPLM